MPKKIYPIIALVAGTISEGSKKATALGYPTVNLAHESRELPAPGIYAGALICDGEEYPGAICLAPDGKLEIHCVRTAPRIHLPDASFIFYKKISDFIPGNDEEMKRKIADDIAKTKEFFTMRYKDG